ncbi:MAG: hypothetical protein GC178_11230 [Flavobacteriales bacterium]|nr:hypothetical protein [Flavobacteriales bacterium]
MALGITSIFKKKVSEEKVAELFVNIIFNAVDTSFAEVAELLNNDLNLISRATIDSEDQDDFLMVVIAGNFHLLDNYFFEGQEDRIRQLTIEKLAAIYGVDTVTMRSAIDNMLSYFGKINYPSKNTHYAMSRAVFYKYGLNDFQKDYFKNLNTPDPILLKNIDEIMEQFIIKWDTFTEKFRITD